MSLSETEPAQVGSTPKAASAMAQPIRWGYVAAVTLPLIILNTGWIANSEMKTGVTELTISALFLGVTFILFVLTLLNLLLRRLAGPRAGMTQPEMMALYTLLSMSSAVAGVGHFGFFTPFLTDAFYYATPSNGWRAFWYLIPSSVGPRDPAILKGFYLGHATFFQPQIMQAWALPLVIWCVFFLVLLWTTLCVAAILRRRWADEEHLPFPILALPLEMTREGSPLYRNRLLWLGFAIPAFLHSLNSLQSIYPTLPTMQVNTTHDLLGTANLHSPWTGAGTLFYQLHPAGIGFGYLVNTDVSFSLWFFYLLKKVVSIWAVTWNLRDPATGWSADANGQFPYVSDQGFGAWLILGLAVLWTGRGSFREYLLRAWRGSGTAPDEPMSPRVAVLGFLGGFFAMCAFVWAWGGSWWLPPVFLGIYLLLMVTLSRLRAEIAVVSTEMVWVNPQTILTTALGSSGMSPADLTHTATLSWFNLDYRAAAMPQELEGMVGLERARARLSPLVPALMFAAAIAMVAALLWDLQLYYVHGADTGNVNRWRIQKGSEAWNNLQSWLHNPKAADPHALIAMAVGIGLTLLLSAMRARFVGFPLHPAAYALNMSFSNDFFWGDMLVAWLAKALILRYGGMSVYRQGLPFFLGLILGDFVTGAAWSIVGMALHLNLFRTFAT